MPEFPLIILKDKVTIISHNLVEQKKQTALINARETREERGR